MARSEDSDSPAATHTLAYLSGGFEFAIICTAFALFGSWLDTQLGTAPWLLVLLLVVGFGGATWLLLKRLSTIAASDKGGKQ